MPLPHHVAPLGDTALTVTLGDHVSRAMAARVHAAAESLRGAAITGVVDVVPAYTTLAVHFDPRVTGAAAVRAGIERVLGDAHAVSARDVSRLVEIPVAYDGVDLADVARATGLEARDVAVRHSAPEYFAYLLGFVPGFAYLGDLDPALVLPRRATPRARVPAGAVAIAGAHSAVYPLVTPGGWHIIGSTDAVMFDPRRDPPVLVRPGDRVRFVPRSLP